MSRIKMSEQMLISAVRYALGRATYIVGDTCDEVRACWKDLELNTRTVIARDIRQAGEFGPVGMDMDDREWRRLLAWIDAQ